MSGEIILLSDIFLWLNEKENMEDSDTDILFFPQYAKCI